MFIAKGYRRTRLTDVGKELGLSHGMLYRYVASKEALFELALVYAMNPEAISALVVPVPAPPSGRALKLVRAWAAEQARFTRLHAAAGDSAADPADELGGIIDECYEFVERGQRVLALIKHSELDLPELSDFFFNQLRAAYIRELTDYVRRRTAAGDLRQVRDVPTAARFIIESIAWFGWHRKTDSSAARISDEAARLTVRELLLAAFVPPAQAGLTGKAEKFSLASSAAGGS